MEHQNVYIRWQLPRMEEPNHNHRALRRCLYVPLSVAKLAAGKARRDGTKVTKDVQNGCGTVNQQLRIARGNS